MKQQDKTLATRQRIIKAAIKEFGTNGYVASTVNAICDNNTIPKGLIYHNFSGKDDLYLVCVERCFNSIKEYLENCNIENDYKKYMDCRLKYFAENPYYARIFFDAVLQPPAALIEQINDARQNLENINKKTFIDMLSKVKLRKNISNKDALEHYELMQKMFNGYFSSLLYSGEDFQTLIDNHEKQLSRLIDLMIYGIGEKKDDE